ncbi:MAG: hypothetical protein EON55_25325, partial [Alphaproteobacteria bacterium]
LVLLPREAVTVVEATVALPTAAQSTPLPTSAVPAAPASPTASLSAFVPTALQGEMGRLIALRSAGDVDAAVRVAALDNTFSALADAQGGLERIKNTPLPRQFEQFPRVFVIAYCLLLPIGLVSDLHIMTPIGSTVIGFAFYLLDQIGRDLEDPFSNHIHDVPMGAITTTIEIDLLQMLGDTEVPKPRQPVDGILN